MDHKFKKYTHVPNTMKTSKIDFQIALHYGSTHW